MKYIRVHVVADQGSILLPLHEGSESKRLYDAWKSSGHDDDFEELADWIECDVKESMEFYIEDITED